MSEQYLDQKAQLVELYNQHAPAMENLNFYYEWVKQVFLQYKYPQDTRILDVGCGTGALLERMSNSGYQSLTGIDFSTACINLSTSRNANTTFIVHDIEVKPLPEKYQVAFMTNIIDFLEYPVKALTNVRESLADDGVLFITFRNLYAYFPWYHLRSLAKYLNSHQRIKHWFLQLTTPLAFRRNDWPIDNMYTPGSMKKLLKDANFRIVRKNSNMILPMLWIPGLRLFDFVHGLNDILKPITPRILGFSYMLICQPG